jgi:UDP-N-acetylglucosamine acyltransferase
MAIHETAIIDPRAQIGSDNEIGPHVVIEGPVHIGNGNIIETGAIIKSSTVIGNNNHIHCYALIGHDPQDVSFEGGDTRTVIGDGNIIREFVTIHRATSEEKTTTLGNNNYLMVSSHVAHDVIVGNNNFLANYTALSGHCIVGDRVFLSAYIGVHQFVRIGSYAMIGALCKLTKDVPPYMMVADTPPLVHGINTVGLRRNGFSPERRTQLKRSYVQLYRSGANVTNSLVRLREMVQETENPEVKNDFELLISFIETSKRGILLKSPKDKETSLTDVL